MTSIRLQAANTLDQYSQQSGRSTERTHTIMPLLISAILLAKHLSIHERTVQRWTKEGRIPYHRIGRLIRYSLNDVLKTSESRVQ